ncbi:uncharacterized protein LOC133906644 [Phragmites australis]|uniref:uncharacterized protein LOC133906644 n=1 Tax=Phragmites australis TaxID=29695 RepID=UPI002D77F29F|nr:uncharacterized protein LOC133906644 [Phragmites australis]
MPPIPSTPSNFVAAASTSAALSADSSNSCKKPLTCRRPINPPSDLLGIEALAILVGGFETRSKAGAGASVSRRRTPSFTGQFVVIFRSAHHCRGIVGRCMTDGLTLFTSLYLLAT